MTLLQKKILGIAVIVLVLGMALATLLSPKKEYSENENRYLKSFPKFAFESVKNTEFMTGLEDYTSDHFVLRDYFMTVKTRYERVTGRDQVNGVYICKDGYYIKQYKVPQNNMRVSMALKRLAEGCGQAKLYAMLVPTAVTIYADKLPANAINADQLAAIEEIKAGVSGAAISYIDVTNSLMQHKDEEQLYFKLDHHWTQAGAYLAYVELCKALGLEALERERFTEKLMSEDFKGTFYSDVNDLSIEADSLIAFYLEQDLRVEYTDKKLVSDSLYAEEYLEKKDKYSFFLNNQNSYVEISNEKAATDREIVLVKDSYANCFVPFLTEHFAKIYVIDTRYYRNKVTEFIQAHEGVTEVLFLYNMYTLDTDTGIGGIY